MGVEEIPNLFNRVEMRRYTESEKSITVLMNPKWVWRYSITSSGADYCQLGSKCLRINAETLESNFHHSIPIETFSDS